MAHRRIILTLLAAWLLASAPSMVRAAIVQPTISELLQGPLFFMSPADRDSDPLPRIGETLGRDLSNSASQTTYRGAPMTEHSLALTAPNVSALSVRDFLVWPSAPPWNLIKPPRR